MSCLTKRRPDNSPNTHLNIVGRHERAKAQTCHLWTQFHRFLAAEFDNGFVAEKSFIVATFSDYPFILHQLAKMEWGQSSRERLVETKMIRKVVYAQLKQLKGIEQWAKKKIVHSTRFNAFTFIVYRSYKKNLDFTRPRVMQYLS